MAAITKDSDHAILSIFPTIEHKTITGLKLPSYNQVILCILANNDKDKFNLFEEFTIKKKTLNEVADQVIQHYAKACIPVIKEKNIIKKIEYLIKEYKMIVKHRHRVTKAAEIKRKKFNKKMEKTMPFWPKNVMKILQQSKKRKTLDKRIEIDKDIIFLKSMMGQRLDSHSNKNCHSLETAFTNDTFEEFHLNLRSHNHETENSGSEKLVIEKERARAEKAHTNLKEDTSTCNLDYDFSSSPSHDLLENVESESDIKSNQRLEVLLRSNHKRTVKTGTNIFVPHDILRSKKLQSTAIRNNISPVGLAAIVQSLIETCGGEKEKVNLHHSQCHRYIMNIIFITSFYQSLFS